MWNNILLFFQFLTRVPINKNLDCSEENFKKGIFSFVLVGAFLGLVDYGILILLDGLLPPMVVAGFLVIVPIVLTGGMQIDGIGDTCDGFFAFKEGGKERRIEIMKDSRVGTFAVIGIIWDMSMKFIMISYIISSGNYAGIIMFMILSRLGVMYAAYIGKRAKKVGTGNLYIQNIGTSGLVIAHIIVLIAGFLSGEFLGTMVALPVIFAVVYIFDRYCIKKIGGQSGDTLGATNELCEIAALMLFTILIYR